MFHRIRTGRLDAVEFQIIGIMSNTCKLTLQSVVSQVLLGLSGVMLVMLSVLGSVGFFSAIGVKSTLIIMEVIPFLVLAVSYSSFCTGMYDTYTFSRYDPLRNMSKLYVYTSTFTGVMCMANRVIYFLILKLNMVYVLYIVFMKCIPNFYSFYNLNILQNFLWLFLYDNNLLQCIMVFSLLVEKGSF